MRFRRMIELATRRLVLKRRLPPEFGRARLYVAPDAALSYMRRGVADAHAHLIRVAAEHVRPGASVWDIGANVGLFSVAAAARTQGQVLAVEPDAWLCQLIRRSATVNKFSHLEVLPAAVSDRPGIERLLIAQRGRASNAIERTGPRTQAGGVRATQLVPSVTLDMMLDTFGPPSLVKIDVEGAEILVLNGAQRLLSKVRPILYCEAGSNEHVEVARILKPLGYRFFDGQRPERGELPGCAFNTLALPE